MSSLGNLEETILLIILVMEGEAYGVSISETYEEQMGKRISIPAIYTVLKRLERKGFVKSGMGGSTTERGGRQKRLYEITKYGYQTLCELRVAREKLWSSAPNLNFT